MAHSIGLGMIGMDAESHQLLVGVLQENVIPAANIYIVEPDAEKREQYQQMGIHCEPDVSSSILRSEIMIVSGNRRDLSSTLSSICGVTRGKILVSMVEGRNCEYIQSRVAKATNVVCVEKTEVDGHRVSRLTYSDRFPNHMKSAVNDIFKSIGAVETAE
ncbi:MAG: NAD(P)-binding domain-containing protein [Butyricicoccus sp.]